MTTDKRPPESIALEKLVNTAIEQYGDQAVLWAWSHLFAAFIPLAASMLHEQRMFEAAKKAGLGADDVEQAFVLLASLRGEPSDHNAWVAADVIQKYAKDPARLLVAIQSVTKKETH
jgi:hypothetical protein